MRLDKDERDSAVCPVNIARVFVIASSGHEIEKKTSVYFLNANEDRREKTIIFHQRATLAALKIFYEFKVEQFIRFIVSFCLSFVRFLILNLFLSLFYFSSV